MLNKTIRSVLSLALVFCLLLGMSGNAIALAVSNPVDGTLEKVDTKVYGTIDELNATIDDLEELIDELEYKTLPEAVAMLEDAEAKLADAEAKLAELTHDDENDDLDGDVTKGNALLAEAQEKLAEAKAQLEGDNLADLKQTAKEKAQAEFDKLFAEKEAEAWELFYEKVGEADKEAREDLQAKLDQAKADLNQKIADKKQEMEDEIADRKAEMNAKLDEELQKLNQKLADELAALEEKLALAGADQDAIDAARAEYDEKAAEARAEYDKVAAEVRADFEKAAVDARADFEKAEDDAWATYYDEEAKAWQKFNDAASDATADARADLVKAIADAKVDAQAQFDEKFETEFNAKVSDLEAMIPQAETEMAKAERYVVAVNKAVEYFEGQIKNARAVLADAYKLVSTAQTTIDEARETIAQARELVNNLEKSYNDLRTAVTNPEPSLSFIKETVAQVEANYNAVWNALLDLDKEIDDVIAAYEALGAVEIGEIHVQYEPISGETIYPVFVEVDLNGDGVITDDEVYGNKETKTLDPVDFSDYEFHFTQDDIPQIPEMPEMLTKLDTTLDSVIAKGITLNEALATYVPLAKKAVAKALDVAEETLGITYDFLKANLSRDMHKKVYNWLYNNPDKVCALVEKFGVYGLEKLMQYGPYALDLLNDHFDLAVMAMKLTAGGAYLTATLGAKVLGYLGDRYDFLDDFKGKVTEVARKLYAKYGDEAKALIEVYVDYLDLRERYEAATNAELDLLCNSVYVAIGNTNYAGELAEKLNVTGENYFAISGSTVKGAIGALEADSGAVAAAELITVHFGNQQAIQAAAEVLRAEIFGENVDECDWSVLANETVHELVDKSLAELETELVEHGLSQKNVGLVLDAAEAYAYTYALQQVAYIDLINEIQAVNADATIVIVGGYNEMAGISVILGSELIEIGKYMEPMVFAMNLQSLAEGFLNENVIFVDVHETELKSVAQQVFDLNDEKDALALIMSVLEFGASEDGYTYIAEQIYAALGSPIAEHVPGEAVKENEVPATCTTDGSYDLVVYCSECKEELSRETVTVEGGHNAGEPVVENEVPATCTENGSHDEVVYCTVCGEELSRETVTDDAPGHTADEAVIENEVFGSCATGASYDLVVYCSVCGAEMSRETVTAEAPGHVDGETVIENEVPATCTKDGSHDEVVYCAICGEELSRKTVIDSAPGHVDGETVIENDVPVTCTKNGSYDLVVYCDVCGEELSRETVVVKAQGHICTGVETEPTCTEAGYITYKCDNCDYSYTEEGKPATGHNYVPHYALDATCTENGWSAVICLNCEHVVETVIPAKGHVAGPIEFVNEVPATCTEDGSVEAIYRCEVCGEVIDSATYTLKAIGHSFGDWELVKLPTLDEDGELRRYCLKCDHYESIVLPALNAPDFDFDCEYRDEILDTLRKLYDVLGDKIFDLVEDATHANYTIFHDSLYVAIGDSTATGSDSYVDRLAELLEIPHMTENLAQADMTIAEAIKLVGKESDLISQADLITLSFSNLPASMDMLNALNGEQTTDWSAAVGEKAANAIDKALEELKARLIAEGLDDESVNMVLDAANAYAYAYAARAMLYPSLVDTVRGVNEDALIVIVGTYNDLEGVVIDVNGREINVGKYVDYLIYAANLENLLQAIHGENVIYVHAPEVETVFEENAYENVNNLGYLMSIAGGEMLPSEAGHAYIAQQIRDALTVEYRIWGDVNGDRKVNCRDARLVLLYAAELITADDLDLTWADVNADGKVNARDARMILTMAAELIDHFPVCRFENDE